MKTFKIKENVFKTETLFLVDCDYKEANNYFKNNFNLEKTFDAMNKGSVVCVENEKTKYYFRCVWIEKLSMQELPCVVHELLHLIVRILEDKGVAIKVNHGEYCGDKTAAYLLEFYFTEILKRLENVNKKSMKPKKKKC